MKFRFYASLWSVIYGVCCSPKRVQRLVLGTLTITMRCTFSGRLLNKQSNKCLLISNDGENGPSAPALASMQRFKIALATSPETLNSLNLSTAPSSDRYQCPPPAWTQPLGFLLKLLKPEHNCAVQSIGMAMTIHITYNKPIYFLHINLHSDV